MQGRKERARSLTATSSDLETNSSRGEQDIVNPKKKARTSQSAIINMFQEDLQKNDDIMRLFIAHAEQDRLDQKERWEKEYALRMRQLDLQFAEFEERKQQYKK